jgi:hypothetical protein
MTTPLRPTETATYTARCDIDGHEHDATWTTRSASVGDLAKTVASFDVTCPQETS